MTGKYFSPVALIFTANGSGLGHISRAVKIANALARHKWSVLVVTGNPAVSYLTCDRGVDVIRLPCLEKSKNGIRRTRTDYSDVVTVLRTRRSLVLTLAIECKPSLLIVDHKPAGIAGEVLDILRELKKRNVPRVLLLRDFGGDPAIVRDTWEQDNAWSALDLYSQIVVLGDKSAYDWENLIAKSRTKLPISYLGFLVAKPKPFGYHYFKRGSLVLGGGGAHAHELFLKIISDLLPLLPQPVTMCTGPLMAHQERSKFVVLAAKHATVMEYIPSLEYQLNRFELTVSQAGSISTELAYYGVNTVLVPRNQKSREQQMRAQYWAQTARHIHVSDVDNMLDWINALRQDIKYDAQSAGLRENLPNLFVTPDSVINFILNEASSNH